MGVQINGDTGNISATKADYSGNVTIGGTLTYEDVTNIDSVGLITAREGIEVGARPGVAASISVDGNAVFSGIVTAASFSGIDLGAVTGATGDFSIADKIVHTGDTDTAIRFPSADTITAETGGTERLRITSDGKYQFPGTGGGSGARGLEIDTESIGAADEGVILNARASGTTGQIKLQTNSATAVTVEGNGGNVNVASNLKVAGVCTATSFSGSGAALTGISAGITEFDMWTLQTNHSADASSEILGVSGSSTLQRHTSMNNSVAQAAQIGTGMSFDSSTGIFTFPSTGKYLVINNPTISIHSNDNAGVMTRISTDGGSNFTTAALPYMGDTDGGMHSGISFNFVDVTDTSLIKVRFRQDSLGTNSYVVGNNGYARTVFIFARIGDT